MSQEQLKAFFEKVKGDTSLQEKLKAAADADSVAAIAENSGYKISTEDIEKFMTEISDKELEGVAGGGFNPTVIGPGSTITIGDRIVSTGIGSPGWSPFS